MKRLRQKKKRSESAQIPIAPMIDCVFLLLVYFISTSSMKKTEADLEFALPVVGKSAQPLMMQKSQLIQLSADGNPLINGYQYPRYEEDGLGLLQESLKPFYESCLRAEEVCKVEIEPDPETPHQYVIQLLDAIAHVGISDVRFRF